MMRRAVVALLAALTLTAPAAAAAQRRRVDAYVELDQAVTADLLNDDAVTYTQVATGVDAAIDTARAHAQVSARYERQFAETRGVGDADEVTGLARASYQLARPLTLEAGALGTRTRVDIRGAAAPVADVALPGTVFADNTTQLYSVYAGPTLATAAGPVALTAAYRFDWTKVDAPYAAALPAGAGRQDYFDTSTGHQVTASAAIAPGRVLPVGITLSGGYTYEGASQLDQRYDDWFGRGDVLLPVTGTFAVAAGLGYEHIQVTQKDPVVAANGAPVLDVNGRFETNEVSAPRLAYLTDGLIYDAGVVWRPSPRTRLTATVAHEYGSTTYTGEFDWRIRRDIAFRAAAYDAIETFGHQLAAGLQALPTDFVDEVGLGQNFNGCVFGAQGSGNAGAGGCLNDVFQSITTASYRARGFDAILSATSGRNRFGIGAGYANRHLFSPRRAPGLVVYGLDDDSWYAEGFYGRQLGPRSSFDANVFANWYSSAVPVAGAGSGSTFGAGATGAYTRSFGRLGATAQAGIYTFNSRAYDEQWVLQGLLGARYLF